MRPEYRVQSAASQPLWGQLDGVRPMPPHPAWPAGPECSRTAPSCSRTGATTAMTGKLFRPPRPTVLATSAGTVLHCCGIRSTGGADRCAASARASSECADACCRRDRSAIAGSSVCLCPLPGRCHGMHRLRPRSALLRQWMQQPGAPPSTARQWQTLPEQPGGALRACAQVAAVSATPARATAAAAVTTGVPGIADATATATGKS